MTPVQSNIIISPSEYLKLMGIENKKADKMNSADFRIYMDNNNLSDYWDYPLSEIDEIMEHENPVVLVKFSTGEVRWCETEGKGHMPEGYPLSMDEYIAIVNVAKHTKCDCWLKIIELENKDMYFAFYDLENNGKELDLYSVMQDLYDAASVDDIDRLIASKKIQKAWEGLVKQYVFGNDKRKEKKRYAL